MLGLIPNSRYCYITRVVRHNRSLGEIVGIATVRPEHSSPGLVRMHVSESGEWTACRHRGLTTRNAWFAQQATGQPTVAIHRARGRAPGGGDSAFLLHLVAGPHAWHTEHPHPCAQDAYSLTTRELPGGLVVLEWTVTGPAKDDRLTTTYTPTNTPAPRP